MQDNCLPYTKGAPKITGTDPNIFTDSAVECVDLYKRRLIKEGFTGDPTQSAIQDMQESFVDALNNSYSSEKVEIVEANDGIQWLALVFELDSKFDSDKRKLSMPFESNVHVGNTIDWLRPDYKYLVMSQDYSQKAYFSGTMERANYILKWTDDNGNIYEQWVVVKGPDEKTRGFHEENDMIVDEGEQKLELFIGKTSGTEFLKRYKRLILGNIPWYISTQDDLSNPDLVRLSLTESVFDNYTDDEAQAIADILVRSQYTLSSGIPTTADIGYEINPSEFIFYKDGKVENVNPINYKIYVDDELQIEIPHVFTTEGEYEIKISVVGYPPEFTYTISIEAGAEDTITYQINGDTKVREGLQQTYTVDKFVNGAIQAAPSGIWTVSPLGYVETVSFTSDSITLKPKKLGDVELKFIDSSTSLETIKNIKVTTLIG
jgi:hypothetical protein